MIYAKQVTDDVVVALLTYDYEPQFDEDTDVVIITEEEYNELMKELIEANNTVDEDVISAAEALSIIVGGIIE